MSAAMHPQTEMVVKAMEAVLSPKLSFRAGPGRRRYAGTVELVPVEKRQCYRLPSTATKAERVERHKQKMAHKASLRVRPAAPSPAKKQRRRAAPKKATA